MSNFDRNAGLRYGAGATSAAPAVDQGLRTYMIGVYNHMTLGLAVTGATALGTKMLATAQTASGRLALTPIGQAIYQSPLRWLVMFAPLALVMFFSFRVDRMSASAARGVFVAFAAIMGVSLSSILLVYTGQSVAGAFFQTAAAFGALSLYGYTTRRDLSPMGSFLIIALFGLIVASIVNLFVMSSGVQWALAVVSALIFAGLTAYDTQAIKEMYYEGDAAEVAAKKSIYGALQLYLDFINMFLSLLRLFGNRNN
ncbi:MAG: Bax inhibitor-1/YccA family protein [Hyphomicrobiales bacterium]|nr:Bax inhibitor-1/YccA family protein [Hyphomicrobiales bacterium]MDE2018680.1 Bax inhibitor-1/YccA family protein [Hyphomicrobiales bacterium]